MEIVNCFSTLLEASGPDLDISRLVLAKTVSSVP